MAKDISRLCDLARGRLIHEGLTASEAMEVRIENMSADQLAMYYRDGSMANDGLGLLACRHCGDVVHKTLSTKGEGNAIVIRLKCSKCNYIWTLRMDCDEVERVRLDENLRLPR